jgi:hypothetical protein
LSVRWTAAATIVLALAAGPVRGDVVVLRNGQELRGRVSSEGDKVRVELEFGGTVTIARGDVLRTVVEETKAHDPEAAVVSQGLRDRLAARERLHRAIEALAAPKQETREAAEDVLVHAGRAALPFLRPALTQGTTEQRRHVLRALTAIGDVDSLPAIAAMLDDSKSAALHVGAVKAIAAIGGPEQAPLLTHYLVNSRETAVRAATLQALVEFRSPFAAPFVVDALGNPDLARTAAAALPHWSDPIALPFLLPRLDKAAPSARSRIAAWVAGLVTPAHALRLLKLADAYRDTKDIRGELRDGVKHLLTQYPVVGAIDLLGADQPSVRDLAAQALRASLRDVDPADKRQLREERQKATQPRIVFVPVGSVTRATVAELAEAVERSPVDEALVITTDVARKALPLRAAGATPMDARPLLAQLDRQQLQDHRTARVVGVTRSPLTMPGLELAMAPTRPGGAVLVSLAHLGKDREIAMRLARRLALHALARSFGLPPSPIHTCPSAPLYEPADLTTRTLRLSSPAEAALAARWAVEADAAAFLYAGAARRLVAMARKEPRKSIHMQAAYYYERDLDTAAATAQWRACDALESDANTKALIQKRIDALAVTDQWLAARELSPQTRTAPARP